MRNDFMDNPTIIMNSHDVYVEQTNIEEPYNLLDLVDARAAASNGADITMNMKVSLKHVNFSKPGKYSCNVVVVDDSGNSSLDYLIVHVLSPKETKNLENAKPKKRKKGLLGSFLKG